MAKDNEQTKDIVKQNQATVKNIIDYLEEEKELILAESKHYDAQLSTEDMSVKDIDALILRKRLYDVERHLKVIRRLSGLR